MKDDLLILLVAQEIDLEIDKRFKSKNEYPRQIEALQNEIETLQNTLTQKNDRLNEIEKARRVIESELLAERDLLSQKEKRLLETKNNKEYTAVHNEIELARKRIDSLETEDLVLMTEQDALNPEVKELEENLEKTRANNTSGIKDIQKHFDSIESDIAALNQKRNRELSHIKSTRALSIYNRLRKGKSGLAVAQVDKHKHTCKGCFKQLPSQKVLEVRRAQNIIMCENCGRILVWDSRDED
ncbi:C4-type zinc ribbon domain-containing protein [bacterium]|nr:C4-type zinc ribbon domain-containing protein [bacterium]